MSEIARQQKQVLHKEVTRIIHLDYLLYLPPGYAEDESKQWPLMLFLHGAGERGNDVDRVKQHGPPKRIEAGQDFSFLIVSPQCPPNEWWSSESLITLLDAIVDNYQVDTDRVYLTGLSMGGYGTWRLASENPQRFAALVPICGGGQRRMTRQITHIPTWVFHGAKDPVVPLRESEEMVEALRAAGGDVQFTVYPEAEHDSWTATYANPELYEWLLKQRRARG